MSQQLYLHCCEECLPIEYMHKSQKVVVKCLAVLQPSCTVVFRKREVGNLRSNGQPNYQTREKLKLLGNSMVILHWHEENVFGHLLHTSFEHS